MARWNILVNSRFSEEGLAALNGVFPKESYQLFFKGENSPLGEIDGIITRSDRVGKEFIGKCPRLKIIVRAGAGYDNVDHLYAGEKRILVENTPGTNSDAVAEQVFAQILALYRSIPEADSSTKAGRFEKQRLVGREIRRKKFRIWGFGQIGQRVARIARAFGADVYAFDPYVDKSVPDQLGVTLVETPEYLFDCAEIVTLHAPLNESTEGKIDLNLISRMAPDGLLVNDARAELVSLDGLIQAMEQMPGLRYTADVHHEGDVEGEKALAHFGNRVILTPHIAAQTMESNYFTARQAAIQVIEFLERGIPINSVNFVSLPAEFSQYGTLAERLGNIAYHLAGNHPHELRVRTAGSLAKYSEAVLYYTLRGMLGNNIPLMQARNSALERKITIGHEGDASEDREHGILVSYSFRNEGIEELVIRGTISREGTLDVRSIGEFAGLSFQPEGHTVIVTYPEAVGAMGRIGSIFSSAGYNIDTMQIRQNPARTKAIAVFTVNKIGMNEDDIQKLVDSAKSQLNAYNACYINLS